MGKLWKMCSSSALRIARGSLPELDDDTSLLLLCGLPIWDVSKTLIVVLHRPHCSTVRLTGADGHVCVLHKERVYSLLGIHFSIHHLNDPRMIFFSNSSIFRVCSFIKSWQLPINNQEHVTWICETVHSNRKWGVPHQWITRMQFNSTSRWCLHLDTTKGKKHNCTIGFISRNLTHQLCSVMGICRRRCVCT